MYRRWLKQDFKNCLWRLRLVFRFDIQQIRKNRDLLAIFCINALACGWTVALPASLATAACRMCVLFCAWGPGSPGGQQVWLLPLLSSSAFLLLTLVFHSSLFFPPGIQRELKGNSVRWIMIYLYFFFYKLWWKKLTRRDASLRAVRKNGELAFHAAIPALRR